MANGMPVVLIDPATDLPYGAGSTGGASPQIQGNTPSLSADVGNPVKVGAVYSAASPARADGQRSNLETDQRGNLRVTIRSPGQTGEIGAINSSTDALGNQTLLTIGGFNLVFNGTSWDRARGNTDGTFVVSTPSPTSPGVTQFSAISAASDNATVLKATKGKVYGFQIFNTTASAKYVRLYNKASGPTAADAPVRRIMVPANGVASYHVGQGLDGFGNGIGFRATGSPADSDTTALAAGDLIFNFDFA